MIRKTLLAVAALATILAPLFISGCHTFKGMGQDIQAGGKAISKAAN